ncbi:MAG: nucleotidyltransferase family protein [Candidatus Electrothrix scaldis]|nr:MAG: nucleotidyltransferase family protein [Candidatus Electrothrix sp. GW3-3]
MRIDVFNASGNKIYDRMMESKTANELLLFFLRKESAELIPVKLAQLSKEDLDAVVHKANRHRVTSLLYQTLSTPHLEPIVPASITQALRSAYLETVWWNTSLYSELSKILKVLQDENIPVILLKGAHLAKIIYGNIALRPMSDIDIMVKKKDLRQSVNLLFQIGFTVTNEKQVKLITNNYQLPPHFKHFPDLTNGKICLDVHSSIAEEAQSYKIDIDGLWTRAWSTETTGLETLTLSPEDLLLHLCLHTSMHHMFTNGLKSFCDIREVIRYHNDEINWDELQLRARSWRASNPVYLSLHLAKSLLNADIPQWVLEALKPDKPDNQAIIWAKEQIFATSDKEVIYPKELLHFWKKKSSLQKISILLERTFPPRKELAQMYYISPASSRVYFYYPVRLKEIFQRHFHKTLRLLYQDKETLSLVDRQLGLIDWLSH